MTVSDISRFEQFTTVLFQPAAFIPNSRPKAGILKAGAIFVDVFLGLCTLGIGHLFSFAAVCWKSKGHPLNYVHACQEKVNNMVTAKLQTASLPNAQEVRTWVDKNDIAEKPGWLRARYKELRPNSKTSGADDKEAEIGQRLSEIAQALRGTSFDTNAIAEKFKNIDHDLNDLAIHSRPGANVWFKEDAALVHPYLEAMCTKLYKQFEEKQKQKQ